MSHATTTPRRIRDIRASHPSQDGDGVKILRLQAGVIVTPGTEFSPHSGDSLRLNFSQDQRAAVDAIARLAALVERYRA